MERYLDARRLMHIGFALSNHIMDVGFSKKCTSGSQFWSKHGQHLDWRGRPARLRAKSQNSNSTMQKLFFFPNCTVAPFSNVLDQKIKITCVTLWGERKKTLLFFSCIVQRKKSCQIIYTAPGGIDGSIVGAILFFPCIHSI